MIKLKDIVGDRVRLTTYDTNKDETITRKVIWINSDGTQEVVSEEIVQQADVYQSLQDTFGK